VFLDTITKNGVVLSLGGLGKDLVDFGEVVIIGSSGHLVHVGSKVFSIAVGEGLLGSVSFELKALLGWWALLLRTVSSCCTPVLKAVLESWGPPTPTRARNWSMMRTVQALRNLRGYQEMVNHAQLQLLLKKSRYDDEELYSRCAPARPCSMYETYSMFLVVRGPMVHCHFL
jgi:hypothetical protein